MVGFIFKSFFLPSKCLWWRLDFLHTPRVCSSQCIVQSLFGMIKGKHYVLPNTEDTGFGRAYTNRLTLKTDFGVHGRHNLTERAQLADCHREIKLHRSHSPPIHLCPFYWWLAQTVMWYKLLWWWIKRTEPISEEIMLRESTHLMNFGQGFLL